LDNSLYFANRKDWRSWLVQNFENQSSAWLTISRKGTGRKGLDGKLQKKDEASFSLRFSPRKANSVWSKINRDRAEKLIASDTSIGVSQET